MKEEAACGSGRTDNKKIYGICVIYQTLKRAACVLFTVHIYEAKRRVSAILDALPQHVISVHIEHRVGKIPTTVNVSREENSTK